MALVDFSNYVRYTSNLLSNPEVAKLQGEVKDRNLTESCQKALLQFLDDVKLKWLPKNAYTYGILDSYARPQGNIYGGNREWMGYYEECKSNGAKYCTARITSPLYAVDPENWVTMGVCVPKQCMKEDAAGYTNALWNSLPVLGWNGSAQLPLTTQSAHCAEERPWNVADWIVLAILVLVAGFCLSGTILDFGRRYYHKESNKRYATAHNASARASVASLVSHDSQPPPTILNTAPPPATGFARFLLAFSWLTNLERLFDTKVSPNTMTSLVGIRFFSMTWIVLGHGIAFIGGSVSNIVDFYVAYNRITMQPVINLGLAVDSFLVLSALLVTYQTMSKLDKNSMNWAYFYFHRFWRLTPVYIFLIIIAPTLFLHISEGPNVRSMDGTVDSCVNYGWTNILYINNLYPEYNSQGCVGWTWYLAMDMQYYIVSPLFIILLVKFGKPLYGHMALIISIIVPVAISFGVAYGLGYKVYDYPPDPSINPDHARYGGELTYFRPYCRFAPYAVGIFTGYILHKGRGKVQMSKYVVILGWIAAVILGLFSVYGQSYYRYTTSAMPLGFSAFYTAFHRFFWAIAVAWVIVACQSGYGGYIHDFLSWSAWVPLSRMTYSAYLIHPAVMFYYASQLKTRYYIDNANTIYLIFGHFALSMLITIGMVVSIESPLLSLEKLLFPCFFKARPTSPAPAPASLPNGTPHSSPYEGANGVPNDTPVVVVYDGPSTVTDKLPSTPPPEYEENVAPVDTPEDVRKRVSSNSFVSEL